MKIFIRKRVLWLLSSLLALLLSGFFLLSIGYDRDYRKVPSEHFVGNRASHVKALRENGLPFSFLVIGDTQTSKRAKTLIQMALKQGKPAFMVILGDFVKEPDLWRHRFFLKQMTTEIRPSFPVFLVAGNHDIDGASSAVKRAERRVTPEVYESLYGPRNHHFVFNDCLFIIVGVDLKNRTDYLDFLRETLSQRGKGRKHIFVFVHYPPKGLASYIEGPLPEEKEFFSLLEGYRGTTCFFGDYHGYWRGQRNGVNLIVSGGGGRFKGSQSEWGKFHHILKVSVDENKVSEEMMVLKKQMDFEDGLEEMVFTRVFPIIENSSWILYVLFLVFLFWGIYSVIILRFDLRKKWRPSRH